MLGSYVQSDAATSSRSGPRGSIMSRRQRGGGGQTAVDTGPGRLGIEPSGLDSYALVHQQHGRQDASRACPAASGTCGNLRVLMGETPIAD